MADTKNVPTLELTPKHLGTRNDQGKQLPENDLEAATISSGSDRYPYTVVVRDRDCIVLQDDHTEVIEGNTQDGSAKYAYFRNWFGNIKVALMCKRGKNKGHYMDGQRRVTQGIRQRYYDPSF